ncbi:MAG: tol-pal system protein YbgF [Pseudomonadota bacterium]
MMNIRYFCLMVVLLSCLGCVEPQKFATLENRVAAMEMENNRQLTRQNMISKQSAAQNEKLQLKIENDLETVQKKLKGSHVFSKEEYAQLQYDIRTIKEEIQRLQGAALEIDHRFTEFSQKDRQEIETRMERLDSAISKNYEKVVRLENHMGFEPSSIVAEKEKPADPAQAQAVPKDTEQEMYASAKKMFDDGDLENARIQFENFITKYPDSNNADNARFWIADSYYSEKRFAEAILEYQKVLEQYVNSNKLAAARLKQGYSFAELGEHANARLILKELLKKYPDSQEARYAAEKLKSLK